MVMRWSSLIKSPFFFLVVIPTLLAGVYFGLVASDIYVSESRFVVRSQDKEAQSGLGALLQGTGFTHSEDSVYVVRDFMQSRDALGQLEKELNVSAMFGAKSVDLVSRFNPLGVDPSFENLYKYYSRRTDIDVDSTSGITTLTVNTFTDSSAYAINGALLAAAERLVNKMNARMQSDLVAAARRKLMRQRLLQWRQSRIWPVIARQSRSMIQSASPYCNCSKSRSCRRISLRRRRRLHKLNRSHPIIHDFRH